MKSQIINVEGGSFSTVQLVPTPGLPQRFTLSDGTPMVLREMQHKDIPKFYAALRAVIDSGMGYGVDELPYINYFVKYYVDGWRNVMCELEEDGDPVLFHNCEGPTTFSRSATDRAIVDGGNLVIVPKYQRRGWYTGIATVLLNVGLKNDKTTIGCVGDTAVTNIVNYLMARKFGYCIHGILPRGVFMEGRGWLDLMLFYATHEELRNVASQMTTVKLRQTDSCNVSGGSKLSFVKLIPQSTATEY
jgi:hypothetical protein